MKSKNMIDVRGLTPPQALKTVLPRLEKMRSNDSLWIINDCKPTGICNLLENREYIFRIFEVEHNEVRVLINLGAETKKLNSEKLTG
ncbi:MAG: DUF2249 domain-containing protein [Draconibacterium sp.]